MKNLKSALIILTLSFLISCADSDSSGNDSSSATASNETPVSDATTDTEEDTTTDTEPPVIIVDETPIIEPVADVPVIVDELPVIEPLVIIPDEPEEIPEVVPQVMDVIPDIEEPAAYVELEIEPVQIEPLDPVTLSVMVNEILYFYNGEFQQQTNVNPKNCGTRCFTDGATKVYYNELGEVESTELLFMEPDLIVDDWIIENIEPAEALEFGARYKDYTKYYFEGGEYGNWFLNQYKVDDLIKTNTGEIIAISGNNFYSISDLGAINHADKLLIYEFDAINRTAVIDGISVFWFTNYFIQAKQWQYLNGVWFSWNGYEFTDYLQPRANSLWNWNDGENPIDVISPTVINAGTDENYLYFIECNTGWLISFNPEFDQITLIFQLFQGDGLRLSGIDKSLSIKPVLVDGVLYFNDNGLRRINLESGISELVIGDNGEVLRW